MTSKAHLLDAVRHSLMRARRYNPGDVVAPAAVLWTDADGQWRPVVEQLRGLMPELLTLGDHEQARRPGPAIWLSCVIKPTVDFLGGKTFDGNLHIDCHYTNKTRHAARDAAGKDKS